MADFPTTTEEVEVNRFLDGLDAESESAKREATQTWEENLKQMRGDQWRLRRSPYFLANIIKNQQKRKVAALTEAKPQFRVAAYRPDLSKAAEALYQVSKSIFDYAYS